jgi:predicted lipoprotein with Yx(FWY)xxD motif
MRHKSVTVTCLAATALLAAACGSSSPSGSSGANSPAPAGSAPAASSNTVKSANVGGVSVLTNAKGFTLYSFVPDTATKSNCNGSCAQLWPPLKGPVKAGPGVTAKPGTIKRDDGATQATYRGHPLYTYVGDTAPGQDKGNGLNLSGGVWHVVTPSGAVAPAGNQNSNTPAPGY